MPDAWQAALLQLAQGLLVQRDLGSLFRALAEPSVSLGCFDRIHLLLREPGREAVTACFQDLARHGYTHHEDASFAHGPIARATLPGVEILCGGEALRRELPALASLPAYRDCGAYALLRLDTARQPLGAIEFLRTRPQEFSELERELLRELASIVALAVENVRDEEAAAQEEERLRRERDQYRILVDVTNAVITHHDLGALVADIAGDIHRYFGADYLSLALYDAGSLLIRTHAACFEMPRVASHDNVVTPLSASPAERVFQSQRMLLAEGEELAVLASAYAEVARVSALGMQVYCALPLSAGSKVMGTLALAHRKRDAFSRYDIELLQEIAARISMALDKALAYEEITRLKDTLARENRYLSEEIRSVGGFGEIVGESAAMKLVQEQVEMVAASDCTVLILGETGTGKELIARAIHRLSARQGRTMVKLNCAAIPAGLLESDLFGHEKGAFTGATAQRVGRFELADHGTLFLDEVGDMPIELQPKLLRALQEREIERLGGSKVIPVDVRMIAATNRDLTRMVAERQYRSDLYYRLNVFPIVIPPLRERPGDIPLLAHHLAQKIARRMNRRIDRIPDDTLAQLARLAWPGNVRELENVIERAIILCRGTTLELPVQELRQHLAPGAARVGTMSPSGVMSHMAPPPETADDERQRIIRVLRETNGIVAGPRGAAVRLGLKRTTLLSRMQRLGISVKGIEDGPEALSGQGIGEVW